MAQILCGSQPHWAWYNQAQEVHPMQGASSKPLVWPLSCTDPCKQWEEQNWDLRCGWASASTNHQPALEGSWTAWFRPASVALVYTSWANWWSSNMYDTMMKHPLFHLSNSRTTSMHIETSHRSTYFSLTRYTLFLESKGLIMLKIMHLPEVFSWFQASISRSCTVEIRNIIPGWALYTHWQIHFKIT